MPLTTEAYWTHFNPSKNREELLWRAGYVVQSAELAEQGQLANHRLKAVADALFKDGARIRDAGISIDQATGVTQLAAGVIYARGMMRGVAPKTVTIPLIGTVFVGLWLLSKVVTENEDPTLRDPALQVRNQHEPGAARLVVDSEWGLAGDHTGEGKDFYAVYTIIDGVVQNPEAPPNIDAVALAIAKYDRESTGGYYISEGMRVTWLADAGGGEQVFSLEAGQARIGGKSLTIPHARRVVYAAQPDLKQVTNEPYVAAGGTERINLRQGPVHDIQTVTVIKQKTLTVLKGLSNNADPLPDTVVSIVAVNQGGAWNGTAFTGGTTFQQGAGGDYQRTGDTVDWTLTGGPNVEPSQGSTYQVAYQYVANVAPASPDPSGFTVSDAIAGSTVSVTYRWRRPRIDRLCMDATGQVVWVQGTPADVEARRPVVPDGLLAIAQVKQTWTTAAIALPGRTVPARSVDNDGVRMQTMSQIESLEVKVDNLFAVVSEHQLMTLAALSDPSTKRGIFTDNFDDDRMRDAGVTGAENNAAVVNGALTLPITNVQVKTWTLPAIATLPLNEGGTYAVVSQTLYTTCMKVNPYMAFDPIPARCRIEPAVDFWTEVQDVWLSPVTRRFTTHREVIDRVESLGWLTREIGITRDLVVTHRDDVVRTRAGGEAQFCRQIEIRFTCEGFGAGESLTTVSFDGVSVAFTA